MQVIIPMFWLKLAVLWIGVGTIVNTVWLVRLSLKWLRLPEDKPLIDVPVEDLSETSFSNGLTKPVIRQVVRHFLLEHGAYSFLLFVMVTLWLVYRIVAWPKTLWSMISKGKPPRSGGKRSWIGRLLPVPGF